MSTKNERDCKELNNEEIKKFQKSNLMKIYQKY